MDNRPRHGALNIGPLSIEVGPNGAPLDEELRVQLDQLSDAERKDLATKLRAMMEDRQRGNRHDRRRLDAISRKKRTR